MELSGAEMEELKDYWAKKIDKEKEQNFVNRDDEIPY
jgi:hypothetical protein